MAEGLETRAFRLDSGFLKTPLVQPTATWQSCCSTPELFNDLETGDGRALRDGENPSSSG